MFAFKKQMNNCLILVTYHIKNNGHLSRQIHISKGIRQGCPVSSLLYLLAAEVLATKIRSSSSIKGIEIGNKDKYVKLSQYTDDGMLFLGNKDELCSVLNVLLDFGKVAGTVLLNAGKCEGM